jgi:Short C-terminal domain
MDRELQARGVPAQAEILEISGNRVGDYDSAAPTRVSCRIRVHPDGGEPVETTVKQLIPINLVYHLEPGNQVPVVHDPGDPSKAAIDLEGKSAAGQAASADRVAAQQEYMEQIKQLTGDDPNRPKTDADVADAIRTAQQFMGQNAKLIEQLKASGVPGAQAAGAPEPDPIERLERLAKLRDSGAISEDEFARLKGEILGN